MDINSNLSRCCLCLLSAPNFLNIVLDNIEDKTIVDVLRKHFWFELTENESNQNICKDCWIKVKDFHLFYTQVYNIHFKLGKNIKEDIDENKLNLNLENGLIKDFDFKSEGDINIEYNYGEQDALVTTDLGLKDGWSEQNIEPNNYLSESDEYSSSDESSPPPKQRQTKKTPGIKRRKDKTVKIAQMKKGIDSVEQLRIEQQNTQISEYFSMDCELCSLKLGTFRNLQYHYRKEHKMKGYIRCCSRKYVKRIYILDHLNHHLNPESFRCETCNKTFAANRCLQVHLRNHIPKDERPFKCPKCPKTYVLGTSLKRHLQTHASEKKFGCDECDKSYATGFQLKNHHRMMHLEIKEHICDKCAKSFSSKYNLQKHQKYLHGSVPLSKVQCNVCGSWVKDKHYLTQHMIRHAKSNTSVSCNICGKSTPNVLALQSHKRGVHNNKIYKCNLCNKTFKRTKSLKEHMASHTGDILYSCPYCPKTFNSSANMYSHRKKIHVKEWEEKKLARLSSSTGLNNQTVT